MLKGVQLTLMMGAVIPEAVPSSVIEALSSVQVTNAAGGPSGFQLTFSVGKLSPLFTKLRDGYFDPPRRVVIVVTLNGRAHVLMDGVITKQDLAPSDEPGETKLTITGEDLSRILDLTDLTGLIPYPAMPIEARIALMIAKYAMYGIVPLIIPSVLVHVPNPLSIIPAQRGTDLQYIKLLAERVGYVFYIEAGPKAGMSIAYWGPQIKTGAPQAALVVNSDAANNADSLSFSFDGFAKTLFLVLIQEPISKIPIPIPVPDVNPLSPPLGQKMPIPLKLQPISGLAKFTPVEAALVALAKAAKSADVISGQGSLDVLRFGQILEARRLVEVRGAGIPHDGLYYVRSVTHDIKPGQYKQNYTLSRNALVSLAA